MGRYRCPQLVGKRCGRGLAISGCLGQGPLDHRRHLVRHAERSEIGRRLGEGPADDGGDADVRGVHERWLATHQMMERGADGIHVDSDRAGLAFEQLRCGVGDRGRGAGGCRGVGGHCGDAEVGEARVAVGVDQDVVGLDVAVEHTLVVRGLGCASDGDRHLGSLPPIEGPLAIHPFAQRPAGGELHHDVALPVVGVARLVDGDDVRMGTESAHRLAFAIEATPFGFAERSGEHLDGHLAAVLGVVGSIDGPEATPADQFGVDESPDCAFLCCHRAPLPLATTDCRPPGGELPPSSPPTLSREFAISLEFLGERGHPWGFAVTPLRDSCRHGTRPAAPPRFLR